MEILFPAVLPRRRPDRSGLQEVLSPRFYLTDFRQLRGCSVPCKRHQILRLPVSLNLFNTPSTNFMEYELNDFSFEFQGHSLPVLSLTCWILKRVVSNLSTLLDFYLFITMFVHKFPKLPSFLSLFHLPV